MDGRDRVSSAFRFIAKQRKGISTMHTIRIQTRLESTTLHLPELSSLVGRTVEILVSDSAHDGADAMEALASSPVSATAEMFDEALVESGALSRLA
jgi:hypothetical protein